MVWGYTKGSRSLLGCSERRDGARPERWMFCCPFCRVDRIGRLVFVLFCGGLAIGTEQLRSEKEALMGVCVDDEIMGVCINGKTGGGVFAGFFF